MSNELQQAYDATRNGSGPYWIDLPREEQFRIEAIAKAFIDESEELQELTGERDDLKSELADQEEKTKKLETERDLLKSRLEAVQEALKLGDTEAHAAVSLASKRKR